MEETTEDCIKNVSKRLTIINQEMGDLRDHQEETRKCVTTLKVDIATVINDVAWLKKSYWVVVSTSMGALIAGVISIIVSR